MLIDIHAPVTTGTKCFHSDYILSLDEDPRSLPQDIQKKILVAAYLLGERKGGTPRNDDRNDGDDTTTVISTTTTTNQDNSKRNNVGDVNSLNDMNESNRECVRCFEYDDIREEVNVIDRSNDTVDFPPSPTEDVANAPYVMKELYDAQIVTQALSKCDERNDEDDIDWPLLIPRKSVVVNKQKPLKVPLTKHVFSKLSTKKTRVESYKNVDDVDEIDDFDEIIHDEEKVEDFLSVRRSENDESQDRIMVEPLIEPHD